MARTRRRRTLCQAAAGATGWQRTLWRAVIAMCSAAEGLLPGITYPMRHRANPASSHEPQDKIERGNSDHWEQEKPRNQDDGTAHHKIERGKRSKVQAAL